MDNIFYVSFYEIDIFSFDRLFVKERCLNILSKDYFNSAGCGIDLFLFPFWCLIPFAGERWKLFQKILDHFRGAV